MRSFAGVPVWPYLPLICPCPGHSPSQTFWPFAQQAFPSAQMHASSVEICHRRRLQQGQAALQTALMACFVVLQGHTLVMTTAVVNSCICSLSLSSISIACEQCTQHALPITEKLTQRSIVSFIDRFIDLKVSLTAGLHG